MLYLQELASETRRGLDRFHGYGPFSERGQSGFWLMVDFNLDIDR
jgi:hypothetical protein